MKAWHVLFNLARFSACFTRESAAGKKGSRHCFKPLSSQTIVPLSRSIPVVYAVTTYSAFPLIEASLQTGTMITGDGRQEPGD